MTKNNTKSTTKPSGVQIRHIINFGHPISPEAMEQLGNVKIENVKVDLDLTKPMNPQISKIIDRIKTKLDGTVSGLAIILPGMSEATAGIFASLHGRMGRLPVILPLRRDDSSGVFVVAPEGGQSLEEFRQKERKKRS